MSNHNFKSSFWAAFRVPLQNGKRRFLNVDDVRFSDLSASALSASGGPGESYVEIPPDCIVSGPDTRAAREKALGWLASNGLDPARFADDEAGSGADLRRVLSKLDDADLCRVLVPLDAVAKLL